MSKDERIATAFLALAHPRRVRLFRLLCEMPEAGRSMLALQAATGFKKAPLLHHLRVMENAGLLTRRRKGSVMSQGLALSRLARAMAEVSAIAGVPSPTLRSAA